MPLTSQNFTMCPSKSESSIFYSNRLAESKPFLPETRLANLAINTPLNFIQDWPRCLVRNRDRLRYANSNKLTCISWKSVDFSRRTSFSDPSVGFCTCGLSNGDDGDVGEGAVMLKIAVGPIRKCSEKTFPFRRILGPSSVLVVVTLPKPMGIIFESRALEGIAKECVVVAKLVAGSHAERASRVAQMFEVTKVRPGTNYIVGGAVKPGDVLRATTTVSVIVDFFGWRRPQREMWLYKADGRPRNEIMGALGASFVADGPLTIVLERKI